MKFALITEGPSENRIIKHIIYKCFKDLDPEINQIQPKIINNKQETVGGWNEVLKYCERDELNEIFIENNYLIIQIDTDQSQTSPFNVSHIKEDNTVKTPEELHSDIVQKLSDLIKPEVWEKHNKKIFFAICIHTIECWLLPIYFSNNHKSDLRNCISTLNNELNRKNMDKIPLKDKNNAIGVRSYGNVLKNWGRKKDISESSQYNFGFKHFIESLEKINQ